MNHPTTVLAVLAVLGWARTSSSWTILPDTDWTHAAPKGAPFGFKSHNATGCADECAKIDSCIVSAVCCVTVQLPCAARWCVLRSSLPTSQLQTPFTPHAYRVD